MPKLPIILAVVGAVVVVGGATILLTKNNGATNTDTNTTSQKAAAETKLVDPNGDYDFFSDPSVTKHPEKNAVFGNGQTLTFEYDGSKTNNDDYATLSYQLYYIQDDGKVQPMGGGNMDGRGKGTFTVSNSVFNSNAKNKNGFFELQGTYTTGTSGTNVKLGMYPIKFDVSE